MAESVIKKEIIAIETPIYTAAKGSAEHIGAYQDISVANASNYIWSVVIWNVNSAFNSYVQHIYTDSTRIRIIYYYKEVSTIAAEYKFHLIGVRK